jgi:hypothetical protein
MDALPVFAAIPWALHPAWFALVAVLPPALVWLVCAWRRAYASDPAARRRAGIRELRRLLARVRRTGEVRHEHLHAWRRAVARTWNVSRSAPTAEDIARAQLAITGDEDQTREWQTLWLASERALFGTAAAPSPDWLERAWAAAAALRVPERTRRFPNRLQDWVPAAVVVLVATSVVATSSVGPATAAAPGDSGNRPAAAGVAPDAGREAGAADAAAARLTRRWNDPAAHHALALAHAAREDWNASLVHAVAAFAQAPSHATRTTLRSALDHNEVAARQLQPLLAGRWYERLPAYASPASWQRSALAAALVAAALLSTLVAAAYVTTPGALAQVRRWRLRELAAGGAAIALVVIGASVYSWSAYGLLREPDAAIGLQSANASPVPSDLVPEEETSPFVAGTLVRQRATFLGWRRVESASGATGWVRREVVRSVYGVLPQSGG